MAEPIPWLRAEAATYSSSSRATSPSYQTFGLRLTSPTATAGLPARIANIDLPASSRLRRAPNTSAPGDALPNSVLKSWSSRPTSAASSTSARRSVRSCDIDAMLLLCERPNAKCPALGGRAGHWAHSDLASMRWTERLDSLHTHRSPDLNRGGAHPDGVPYRLKPLMPSPAMGI
jgi:hypothetical protein